MKKVKQFILLILISFVSACSQTPQDKAEDAAVRFSKAMYSLNFDEAKEFCTPDAEKILVFIASNTNDEDLNTLKNAGDVKVSVIESTVYPGDSTATVNLKISNYLQLNMMGGKPTIEKEKEEKVDLVRINDKWLVDLHN
nr:hypothetical protein [uncultured Bacteroides sp.]